MSTFPCSRSSVLAALVTASTLAMAQTPSPSQAPSPSESASPPSMSSSPDAMGRQRPGSAGQYTPGQHHAERHGRGMMGGGMMGGGMGGGMGGHMMGACPMAGALPPGNEKLAMRMHGEIMVAIGNILIKNADNIQPPPAR